MVVLKTPYARTSYVAESGFDGNAEFERGGAMDEPVAEIARRAAAELGPEVEIAVERLLHGDTDRRPAQFVDLGIAVKLGEFLLKVVDFAWKIWRDRRGDTQAGAKPAPAPAELGRRIRVEVEVPAGLTAQQADRVIEVVVRLVQAETPAAG